MDRSNMSRIPRLAAYVKVSATDSRGPGGPYATVAGFAPRSGEADKLSFVR
jgi:hypothetical protein